MKVLITGSQGQLGKELLKNIPHDIEVISADRKTFNLLDLKNCREFIFENRPDWIINAAAYTEVDNAERNKEEAKLINSEFPKILAKLSSKNSILLVHYSSDYIFNGLSSTPIKENEAPSPINYYGITKLKGENHIINHHDKYINLIRELLDQQCHSYGLERRVNTRHRG